MTSPADELRTAADKLRTLATDATDGPWHSEDPNTSWGEDRDHQLIGGGKILATFRDDHNGPLNSDYVARMHPCVALALADWLGTAAETGGFGHDHYPNCTPQTCLGLAALAVARAVLGEEAQ